MGALSAWALPSTQRPSSTATSTAAPTSARVEAYVKLIAAGVMSPEEVRVAERLQGETPEPVTDRY
jgi:phage portal protein BeeE